MKIISESAGFKIELTIPDELKRKGMSDEDANRLINIAYKPFIDKITAFVAYTIRSQDIDSIRLLEGIITNIANSKIKRIGSDYSSSFFEIFKEK